MMSRERFLTDELELYLIMRERSRKFGLFAPTKFVDAHRGLSNWAAHMFGWRAIRCAFRRAANRQLI